MLNKGSENTNDHFASNVKLFPVIYANYRPMADDQRQTETLYIEVDKSQKIHAYKK
jgi:hypothetical protein